jgi:hypothetical protein
LSSTRRTECFDSPIAAAIFCTFLGTDEGDEISGAVADVANSAGDETIRGTMRFHQRDDLRFVWRRVGSRFFSRTPSIR